jgi:predicted flap endonuclease-1-like 5' DNA nuclease
MEYKNDDAEALLEEDDEWVATHSNTTTKEAIQDIDENSNDKYIAQKLAETKIADDIPDISDIPDMDELELDGFGIVDAEDVAELQAAAVEEGELILRTRCVLSDLGLTTCQ